ncbi:MAG: hypothetical protein ACYS17_09945 [Planctomycetota bacterium]|jgi:type II secretory pathway component PulF
MSVVDYKLQAKNSLPASKVAEEAHKDNLQPSEGRHNYCADTDGKAYGKDIFRRTSTKDVCRIARQLATLLRAGMPLVPALRF